MASTIQVRVDDDLKTKVNEFVEINRVNQEELPLFHVAPPCGWMNDPNGFSVYKDKIHLFYQYHPYSEVWGPMHWGHCVTEDFIKWQDMQVALAPDKVYDAAGCFSGSGIETEEGHVLVYTGVVAEEHSGVKTEFQNQCIAIGDGVSYTKNENNPIITGDMLPANFSREHFRDPKIWKDTDGYYIVVGNKTDEGIPQAVLFHSDDLEQWKYVSVLARGKGTNTGTMWECPDFFKLDGEYVLIASPEDICANEEFHNGKNAVYFMGKYNRDRHEFEYHHVYSLDDGLDFYAPQTMQASDGRRIMIAWMQSWDSNIRPDGNKWSCMMTLPRELRIENGRILQSPVREIEKYHSNPVFYRNKEISGVCQMPDIRGRVLDMTVDIVEADYNEFTICFAQNELFYTSLTHYKNKNVLEIDRTYSGMKRDTAASRKVKVRNPRENIKIRLILDKCSAEIFINDGEQVLSTTFYTQQGADEISFECDGTAKVNICKYTISV